MLLIQDSCAAAGFKDLHSFAFLGPSGRIGTAQDGIFAYVPAGPHKQFDMFLHSYQCYKKGLLQVHSMHCTDRTPSAMHPQRGITKQIAAHSAIWAIIGCTPSPHHAPVTQAGASVWRTQLLCKLLVLWGRNAVEHSDTSIAS